MTGADIPKYFHEGCYYLAVDIGVLRYPTAELPEVVRCCQNGRHIRRTKVQLIEDTLELWAKIGDDLAPQLSMFLKRMLEYKNRRMANRLSYWRDAWQARKPEYEHGVRLIMEGVAATAQGKLQHALELFDGAAELDRNNNVA